MAIKKSKSFYRAFDAGAGARCRDEPDICWYYQDKDYVRDWKQGWKERDEAVRQWNEEVRERDEKVRERDEVIRRQRSRLWVLSASTIMSTLGFFGAAGSLWVEWESKEQFKEQNRIQSKVLQQERRRYELEILARIFEKDHSGEPKAELRLRKEAVVKYVELMREQGRPVDLGEVNLRGLQFDHADFRGVILREARLDGAALYKADLRGAELKRAYLCKADLREANLGRAILAGADLRGANLAEANLEDADLSGADLEKAMLRGANLVLAELSVSDAAVKAATGMEARAGFGKAARHPSPQLRKACGDDETKLPEYVERPDTWPCPIEEQHRLPSCDDAKTLPP